MSDSSSTECAVWQNKLGLGTTHMRSTECAVWQNKRHLVDHLSSQQRPLL